MSASIATHAQAAVWVNILSIRELDNYLGLCSSFDAKTERAFNRLMVRLRWTASIAFDEVILSQVAQCTKAFWVKRVWPQLQDFFEVQDGRLSHPDVKGLRQAQRHLPQAEAGPVVKSARHQQSANIRHWGTPEGRAGLSVVPQSHAPTHADRMRPDAKSHDFSMSDASILHENNATDASPVASSASPDAFETHDGASARAGASSLSLKDSIPSESPQVPRESFREREDARTGAMHAAHANSMRSDAPVDAKSHADSMHSDAPAEAKSHGRMARADRPARSPMTPDWQPSAESVLEARKRGLDPDEIAAKFRDHYLGSGELREDWNGLYRNWCRRERPAEGPSRQSSMMMAIPGDKPAPEPDEDTAPEAVKLRQAFGDGDYRAWLREMVVGEMDADGEITVTVPGTFRRDYIKQHFADRLYQLLREDEPQLRRIAIEAASPDQQRAKA